MSNSVLKSFDPLATHPFTNNSGLLPKPVAPSQYPHHSPSKAAPASNGVSQGPIILSTNPVHAPQPKRAPQPKSSSSQHKPIFVPFRPERSSPDLEDILLKKKFVDAFHGKGSWGIDSVPLPSPVHSSGKQGKTHVYTSCYCEENVYLLAQAFTKLSDAYPTGDRVPCPWQVYVVFISNGGKTVALWSQKAARDGLIVWDYHVVLVLLPRGAPLDSSAESHRSPTPVSDIQGRAEPPMREAWVYDLDTTLPVPSQWKADYVAGTFPYALDARLAARMEGRYQSSSDRPRPAPPSLFRVIPADEYLDHFASDRSHMIIPGPAADPGAQLAASDGLGSGELDGETAPEGKEAAGGGGARYASPPPPYPPLRGAKARAMGVRHNLMEAFVEMGVWGADSKSAAAAAAPAAPPLIGECVARREGEAGPAAREAVQHGQVMDAAEFVRWLDGSAKAAR
ncbi:N-terminal glutamine amidase-domain-containing protein [Trametes gibbosa]|nr:N-terminal glutamine amidase-domain-containing protein [Trametes gibbosa]